MVLVGWLARVVTSLGCLFDGSRWFALWLLRCFWFVYGMMFWVCHDVCVDLGCLTWVTYVVCVC